MLVQAECRHVHVTLNGLCGQPFFLEGVEGKYIHRRMDAVVIFLFVFRIM